MKRQNFEPPRIIKHLGYELENPVLSQSLVNDLTVKSTGQEVEDYEFSNSERNKDGFNFEWR